MQEEGNCNCERGGSFPCSGEGFSRRHFLQVAGTGADGVVVRRRS